MARSRENRRLAKEVDGYFEAVLSGERLAGQPEIAAIKRHLDDLENGSDRGLVFDWDYARVACDWFSLLKFPKGTAAGQPIMLQPPQKAFLSVLFGWRRAETLKRRFRRAYLSMARGNGKSPIAAGLATMLFVADAPFTPGAEVVCAATARRQANDYVFEPAKQFLSSIDELQSHIRIKKHEVEFPVEGALGKLYPMGRESTNDGGSFHCVILDEMHAMKELHRDYVEKLETGLKSDHHLMVVITTAGDERSVLWKPEYHYAKQVCSGVVQDDSYFAWIFEIDDHDDPFSDFECLRKANPLLDIAIDADNLRAEVKKAGAVPTKRSEVIRYRGNRLVSSREKAIPAELWNKGNRDLPDLSGRRCFAGLDLGWRDDLAALSLVFPLDDGEIAFKTYAWTPEDGPRDLSREPFRSLIRTGQLTVTEGNTTDHRAIISQILRCRDEYDLQTLAADPNNARAVLTELVDDYGLSVFEFYQTPRNYNEPTRKLLDLLDTEKARHGGQELLSWSADNVVLRRDSAGCVMPDKVKSEEKIDPIVALVMAISEAMFSEKPKPKPRIRII